MRDLRRLPKPDERLAKILEMDVYQVHEDSSDEEAETDVAFTTAARDVKKEIITKLNDLQIGGIDDSIRWYKYD